MNRNILFSILISLGLFAASLPAKTLPKLKLIKSLTINIPEPSGLSFSMDQQSLWSVSDQNGMAYSLSFDGKILSQIKTGGKDLEGIVSHDDLNGACLVEERAREIVCYDQSWKVLKRKKIAFKGASNSGFEGITYNPSNRHFYIVNEKSPAVIIELNNDLEMLQTYKFDKALDLSDIFFDNHQQKFWIISHESQAVFETDLNFQIINQFMIPEVVQGEGISVDSINRRIFIVSDKDSKFFTFEY